MKVIYTITNEINNKIYVGSTSNYKKRVDRHIRELKNNTHHCQFLKDDYEKFNLSNFKFDILYKLKEDENLFDLEKQFTKSLNPEYNIGGVGGGDNLTKNPNRLKIIEKIKISTIKRYSELSKQQKKEIYGKKGIFNGNWKGGHKYFCECGAPIQKEAKSCFLCKDMNGIKNPFYGKKHSSESKEKIRKANLGKKPINSKKVIAKDTEYLSASDAAKDFNITVGAMCHRIKSNSEKWKDFYYK